MVQPLPNGPFDSGVLSPIPGGGVAGGMADLSGLDLWARQGGFGFPNASATPKVLDDMGTTIDIPGGIFGDSEGTPNVLGELPPFPTFEKAMKGIFKGGDPFNPTQPKQKSSGSFFLSPTRIGTAVVGLIFIAAGLFLLGKGPVVKVVTGAAKDLALGR